MGILWFLGYLEISVRSLYAERFINLCKNNFILYYIKKTDDDSYSFYIKLSELYKLKPLLRKTNTHLTIKRKIGLPFLLKKLIHLKIYYISALLFFLIVCYLSSHIWNIKIYGNSFYSNETIKRYLVEKNIKVGVKASSIDCDNLELDIRQDFPEIIWVTAAVEGSKLVISITENNTTIINNENKIPSNIIANSDGIVQSIITRSGTAAVKKGDVVKKGDILIYGYSNTYNEVDEVIKTDNVYADGEFRILTNLPFSENISRSYIKKIYSGKKYNLLKINTPDYIVTINPYSYRFGKYDLLENEIADNTIYEFLGIKIYKQTVLEYFEKEETYADEKMSNILKERFDEYLHNLEEKGMQIVENNVTIKMYENEAQMYGFVYVLDSSYIREEIAVEHR